MKTVVDIYFKDRIAYVVTFADTNIGYRTVEPVSVIRADEHEELAGAILDRLNWGNKMVGDALGSPRRRPMILNYIKLKSWKELVKTTTLVRLLKTESAYKIVRLRPDFNYRAFTNSDMHQESSLNTSLAQIVDHIVGMGLSRLPS
jgi:hypothetical protein